MYGLSLIHILCSLTLAELDLNERILTVTGKGDKQRIVPFYKRLRTLLTRYLRDSRALYLKEEHGFVFVSQRGAPITPRAVQLILAQAGQDAGLNQPLHCLLYTSVFTGLTSFLRRPRQLGGLH